MTSGMYVAAAAARTHRRATPGPSVRGVRRLTAISALMAWTMCTAIVTANRIPAGVHTAENALRTHNRTIVAAGGTDLVAVADPVCGLPADLEPAEHNPPRRGRTQVVVNHHRSPVTSRKA